MRKLYCKIDVYKRQYITSTDVHGLARRILTEETMTFIGADEIYDYFEPLFKTESGNIHHEWLKASYALEKVEAASEKLSLIHIYVRASVQQLSFQRRCQG